MSTAQLHTNRDQWLADRREAIGASEVAAVLGISPWATPWEIWSDKVGKLEPWDGNKHTRAGISFEKAVLDEAEKELGELERDIRIKAVGLPLAATCDAIVVDGGSPVEAKTTGITGRVFGDWGEALTDEVPTYYLTQVHAQLICTGAEIGYLFALIAGRGVVQFNIERNEKLNEIIGNTITDWWQRHIVGGREPSLAALPALDVVKRLKKQPNKTVSLSAQAMALVEAREAAKAREKEASSSVKEIETKLLLELDDAESGFLPDGRELTHFETSRKGYTVAPTTYRTLRVRKAK